MRKLLAVLAFGAIAFTSGCSQEAPAAPTPEAASEDEPEKLVSTLDPDPSPADLPSEADEYCANLTDNNESDDDFLATFIEYNSGVRGIDEESIRESCPEYLGLAKEAKNGVFDGTYVVGDDMEPGTYKTLIRTGQKGIRDCYWERSNGSGETIANDFITLAPDGVTATVQDGEGFTSENCGAWKKID